MPAAHDIYNEELRALRMGDALYHPEPAVGEMPVEIGDVGYTKQGAFNRLFNAGRPANDPLNAQWGVPEGFQPLDMGRVQTYDRELRPGPLHSETISHAAIDIGASGGIVLPADITFCFSCKSSRGAILMLETHMSRTTVQQEGRFKTYLEKHCLAWYQFAADNDILVEFGDIILVTECSNTVAWASAVYSHSARDFALQFSAGGAFLPIQNGLGVSVGYERIGPVKHRRSHRCAITPADVNGLPNDQTVFIKGYRPGPRHLYPRSLACKIRKIMRRSAAAREDRDRNAEGSPPAEDRRDRNVQGSSPPGSGSSDGLSPSMLSSVSHSGHDLSPEDQKDFVTSLSLELPDFHPAVALLAHEVETSSAQVAIIHDDEWCSGTGNEDVARIIDDYAEAFFGEEFLEENTTILQQRLLPTQRWCASNEASETFTLPQSEVRNTRKLRDWLSAQEMSPPWTVSIPGQSLPASGSSSVAGVPPSTKWVKREWEGPFGNELDMETEDEVFLGQMDICSEGQDLLTPVNLEALDRFRRGKLCLLSASTPKEGDTTQFFDEISSSTASADDGIWSIAHTTEPWSGDTSPEFDMLPPEEHANAKHQSLRPNSPVPSIDQSDAGSILDAGSPSNLQKSVASGAHLLASEKRRMKITKHRCSFCPQRFTSRENLMSHEDAHRGIKRFSCEFCSFRKFRTRAVLKRHQKRSRCRKNQPGGPAAPSDSFVNSGLLLNAACPQTGGVISGPGVTGS